MPTTIDTTELTLDSTLPIAGAAFGSATILALNPAGLGFLTPRGAFLSGSSASFQCSYFDADNVPFVPSAISYQLFDKCSGTLIAGPIAVTPAASHTIVVTSEENAMISVSRSCETHELILTVTDGQGIPYIRRALFEIVRAP